jgi:tetratricopeptide (TPR) repeat protein
MNNLAMAYQNQGKLDQALDLLAVVVARLKRTKGEENPFTLAVRRNHAEVVGSLGRTDEMERLLDDIVKSQREVLGNDHVDTVRTLIDLAQVYIAGGRLEKAEAVLKEAEQRSRNVLDPNSEMRAAVFALLSNVYRRKGDMNNLGPVQLKARDLVRARFGPDDDLTAKWNRYVGEYFLKLDEPAKAETYLREEMEYRNKATPDDWSRFICEGRLGASLLGQRKYAEAGSLLLSAYRGMKAREQGVDAERQLELRWTIEQIISFPEEACRAEDRAAFDAILADPRVKEIRRDLLFPDPPFAEP